MTDRIRITNRIYSYPGPGGRQVSPPRGDPVFFVLPVASRRLDENSTTISVTNTTAETTVATLTMPALTISSTGAARFMAAGTISNTGVAGGTVTLRAKIDDGNGATTIAETSGIVCSTSTSLRRWNLHTYLAAKVANGQACWGFVDVSVASNSRTAPSTYTGVTWSTAAQSDNLPITITVTAQLSAASTAFTLSREFALLEGVN